jgi:hypothetical protein
MLGIATARVRACAAHVGFEVCLTSSDKVWPENAVSQYRDTSVQLKGDTWPYGGADRYRAEPGYFPNTSFYLYKDGLVASPVSRASSWVVSDGKV